MIEFTLSSTLSIYCKHIFLNTSYDSNAGKLGARRLTHKMNVHHTYVGDYVEIEASFKKTKYLKSGTFKGRVVWMSQDDTFSFYNDDTKVEFVLFKRQFNKLKNAIHGYIIPYQEDFKDEYRTTPLIYIIRGMNMWFESEMYGLLQFDKARAMLTGTSIDGAEHKKMIQKYKELLYVIRKTERYGRFYAARNDLFFVWNDQDDVALFKNGKLEMMDSKLVGQMSTLVTKDQVKKLLKRAKELRRVSWNSELEHVKEIEPVGKRRKLR